MSYEVLILRRAQKELADLPKSDYGRVRDAVAALTDDPRPVGCKKLVGRDGWRIRSGDYRVIYEVDDSQRGSQSCISGIAEMSIHKDAVAVGEA